MYNVFIERPPNNNNNNNNRNKREKFTRLTSSLLSVCLAFDGKQKIETNNIADTQS